MSPWEVLIHYQPDQILILIDKEIVNAVALLFANKLVFLVINKNGIYRKKIDGTKSSKIKAYKKEIDGLIFPEPRKIMFENYEMDICQRPLRAQTMQGERVALAMSEEIKAGASVTFEVRCFQESQLDLVREWLDYGAFRGIGQWRNSGKGRFQWEEIKE